MTARISCKSCYLFKILGDVSCTNREQMQQNRNNSSNNNNALFSTPPPSRSPRQKNKLLTNSTTTTPTIVEDNTTLSGRPRRHNPDINYEKVLVQTLLKDYDISVRPTKNFTKALNLTFGSALTQIIDVVSKLFICILHNRYVFINYSKKWLHNNQNVRYCWILIIIHIIKVNMQSQ